MANSSAESFGKQLHTWVQTIGIIIAAGWAVYTFIYKEIMVPQSAPINITLNLDLEKVSTYNIEDTDHKKSLAAVKMTVLARNPTSRSVNLLPSLFIVYGYKSAATDLSEEDLLKISDYINEHSHSGIYMTRHLEMEFVSVVAVGEIFNDAFLHPNETVRRTIIFHVPLDIYDVLESVVTMATVRNAEKLKSKWYMDDKKSLARELYHIRGSDEHELIEVDKHGRFIDKEIEYQQAVTSSQMSLR